MTRLPDGGPAFPRTMWTGHKDNPAHRDVHGMSLRAYIATKAMQSLILGWEKVNGHYVAQTDGPLLAKNAVDLAEALITELHI